MPIETHLRSAAALIALSSTLAASLAAAQSSIDLRYDSPLVTYRKWQEQPVQSWRESNDAVGRIGGWRTYSSEPAPGDRAAPAGGHAGHGDQPPEGTRK